VGSRAEGARAALSPGRPPSLGVSRGCWVLQHYTINNSLSNDRWHSGTRSPCARAGINTYFKLL